MKKILLGLLSISLLFSQFNTTVKADSFADEYFYFEGKKFLVEINEEYEIVFSDVKSTDKIIFDPEGEEIDVILDGQKSVVVLDDEYEVSGLLEVTDSLGNTDVVDINEATQLGYNGQAISGSLVIGAGIISAAALGYLILIGTAVLIAGAVYYAIDKVITNIRNHDFTAYFPATVYKGKVWIIPKPITRTTAVSVLRRKGASTYTFMQSNARSIAVSAAPNGGLIHEIDANRKKGNVYFYHFHPTRALGSHSFYGTPYFG